MNGTLPQAEQLHPKITLYSGSCLDVMPAIARNSIDACVCDPPYHLTTGRNAAGGFMGKAWDGGDVAFQVETWRRVLRVLKPGAHLIAFSGTRTYHRMVCAIEDAGFEIRDQIGWLYGSGFPKSHDVSKGIDRAAGAERAPGVQYIAPDGKQRGVDLGIRGGSYAAGNSDYVSEKLVTAPATDNALTWQGWGTALKPSQEPVVVARKPLSEKTVAANVLKWGTGAINIDGCRVLAADQDKLASNWDRETVKDMRGGNLIGGINSGIANTSKAGEGRWPANIIHDGSEEVLAAFPDSDGGGPVHSRSSPKTAGIYGDFSGDESRSSGYDDIGSAARFFYTAKADDDDRVASKHPTVKPVDLMQYLVRLVTPPRGVVLDPFAGTGTTGEAAFREGFSAVLIEREAEYQDDIRRRVRLMVAGAAERSREIVKEKLKGAPLDAGPLFGASPAEDKA